MIYCQGSSENLERVHASKYWKLKEIAGKLDLIFLIKRMKTGIEGKEPFNFSLIFLPYI